MDIKNFLQRYDALPYRTGVKDPIEYFELDMLDAGFDFESDSEEFITKYIIPHVKYIREKNRKVNEEAVNILVKACYDKTKILRGTVGPIKLGFSDGRKFDKLKKKSEKLTDGEFADLYSGGRAVGVLLQDVEDRVVVIPNDML